MALTRRPWFQYCVLFLLDALYFLPLHSFWRSGGYTTWLNDAFFFAKLMLWMILREFFKEHCLNADPSHSHEVKARFAKWSYVEAVALSPFLIWLITSVARSQVSTVSRVLAIVVISIFWCFALSKTYKRMIEANADNIQEEESSV
jgi:uncharacterized membrane protein